MSLKALLSSREEVLDMYSNKMTVAIIARLFRVKPDDVRKAIGNWTGRRKAPHEKFVEDKDAVVAAYEGGMDRIKIARKWCVNVSTVNKYLARWGHPQKKIIPLDIDADKLIRLRDNGLLQKEIADRMGVSPSTINRFLRERSVIPHKKELGEREPKAPRSLDGMEPGDGVKIYGKEHVFLGKTDGAATKWVFTRPNGMGKETFTEWQLKDVRPALVRKANIEKEEHKGA